jgi:hemerythrin-like domain-containing protein
MFAPPPVRLLEHPLEYIFAEHYRHRCICVELRKAAELGQCSCELAGRIAAFLGSDLRLHHEDEEADLFPLLRQRALPEEGLDAILSGLQDDHRKSARQAARITEALSGPAEHDAIAIEARTAELMRSYARNEHRHLAVENGIVLVIARRRLRPSDLAQISLGMRGRRGLAG